MKSLSDILGTEEFNPLVSRIKSIGEGSLATSVADVLEKTDSALEKPVVRPRTVSESLSIIQSKAVTFASYDLTAVQEDMLTLITEQLQNFASNKASLLRPDILGQLSVELYTEDFPSLERNKRKLLQEVDRLRRVDFAFSWSAHFSSSDDARQMFASSGADLSSVEIETKGNIITTRHDVKGTSKVILDINPWALPYLLYYGKGVGGTKFFREIALDLKGKYSKRIYKMLMDWHTLGDTHEVSIAELRSALQIPASYDNNKIRTGVIDKARTEILESGSHITFDYEFVTRSHSAVGTKKAADTILFLIKGNQSAVARRITDLETLSMCLTDIADRGMTGRCRECAARMIDAGKYSLLMSKFTYYNSRLKSKCITREQYCGILSKIVFEESGIELRTPDHLRNLERRRRRELSVKGGGED